MGVRVTFDFYRGALNYHLDAWIKFFFKLIDAEPQVSIFRWSGLDKAAIRTLIMEEFLKKLL